MATLSAVTGRWDDVIKDVRRGRITIGHAHTINDSLLGARLINQTVADYRREYLAEYVQAPAPQQGG